MFSKFSFFVFVSLVPGLALASTFPSLMLNCSDDSQPVGKRVDFKVMLGARESGALEAEIYLRSGRKLVLNRVVTLEKSEGPADEVSTPVVFSGERFRLEIPRLRYPLVYVAATLQAEDSDGEGLPQRLRCGIDPMTPY